MKVLAYMWRHRSEMMLIPAAIAALAVAMVSAFSDQLTPKGLQITVLGVLGFLLTAEIVDRFGRLGKIEADLASIARPRPGDVLRRRRAVLDLEEFCAGAKWLRVCGISLDEFADYEGFLVRLLENGARLQFALCSKEQVYRWALGASHGGNPEAVKVEVEHALALFRGLRKRVEDERLPGSIDWKHLHSLPRVYIIHVDEKRVTERMLVEIQPYGMDAQARPSFALHREDPWLGEFSVVSDKIWEDATPAE